MLNFNHVLVTEFDGEATSSGTLDFQTFLADDTTQISGGYAFAFNGDEEGTLWNVGGVMTADGAGNITMTWDQDFGGSPLTKRSRRRNLHGAGCKWPRNRCTVRGGSTVCLLHRRARGDSLRRN